MRQHLIRWALGLCLLCLGCVIAGLAAIPAQAQFLSQTSITTAVTVTNASAEALAAHQRPYLGIFNDSASATIACRLGGTAVVNGAGSITLPPLSGFTWDAGKIPADAVNCISSAATSAATIIE